MPFSENKLVDDREDIRNLLHALREANLDEIADSVEVVIVRREDKANTIIKVIEQLSAELKEHADREKESMKKVLSAFPDSDARGHRDYHDLVMKREARKEQLQNAIIEKGLIALSWAALVWISAAAWKHFRHSLIG